MSLFPPSTDVTGSGSRGSGGTAFVQRRTIPVLYVHLVGYAKRVGYPVAIPELLTVNGSTAAPCNRSDRGEGFEQTVIGGDAFGNPQYVAKWNLRYLVANPGAGAMPVPPNPLLA